MTKIGMGVYFSMVPESQEMGMPFEEVLKITFPGICVVQEFFQFLDLIDREEAKLVFEMIEHDALGKIEAIGIDLNVVVKNARDAER